MQLEGIGQKESLLRGLEMAKENKDCPSYDDDGCCVTYPVPYSVKCKDLNCMWHDIRTYKKAKKELFKKCQK